MREGDRAGAGDGRERDGGAGGGEEAPVQGARRGEGGSVLGRRRFGWREGEGGVAGGELEPGRPGDEGEGLRPARGEARGRRFRLARGEGEIADLGIDVPAGGEGEVGGLHPVAAVERRAVEAGEAEGPAAPGREG